jgi:hypothetical protein
MLSNFSQYAPQGLAPQIPGLQGIAAPQLNSALTGQPGVYGSAWPGNELGWQGSNSNQQPPLGFGPAGVMPNLQGHAIQNSQIQNSAHMVPVLGQLAQQLAIQSAITHQVAQQVGVAVQHLAHQLAVHGLQAQYYPQNPYAASFQGGYPGFNPQAQAWGPNRPQTIQ